eukprot:4255672-Pleurochrysis_carterae.AAC.1
MLAIAVVVFWYKPQSSHPHLYPSNKKDEQGMPIKEIENGDTHIPTCPLGLELFTTKYVH